MSSPEHPILTYLELQNATTQYQRNGISVTKNRDISNAFNDVACAPFTSFKIPFRSSGASFGTVEDKKAFGSIGKPNVDRIMDAAKGNQSKFGRGEQTVLDLDYRNGYEIEAKDLATGGLRVLDREITPVLNQTLFVGRNRKAEVKLYKLAVYKEGGHFDWHRDTTHGDNHHATALVSLNTAWKGGALLLRHRGLETIFDMRPAGKGKSVEMQVVAFYTDVEHKVDPVTEGVRLVLQYDVYVTTTEDGDDDDCDMEDEDNYFSDKPIYDIINTEDQQCYSSYELPDVTANEDALKRLTKSLKAVLKQKETQEVGFPLRHLYRQQSILPQYLKGVDALMFRHLSSLFEVSLHPILLTATTDYETGSYYGYDASAMVYKCVTDDTPERTDDEDMEDEDEDEEDESNNRESEFYLYDAIDVRHISSEEYIEHTGNESQEGSSKYFGGGMFLREKQGTGDKRILKGGKNDSTVKKPKQK
ncbi:hypothetical protein CPB85DRAFT_1250218 [Mucidula mucida]|nr:hypothetical protein CPB85DRAFT_1250218 [Mucidula mucida]